MAFRWRADDGPLLAVFGFAFPSSTKKSCIVGPPLAKLSGSAATKISYFQQLP